MMRILSRSRRIHVFLITFALFGDQIFAQPANQNCEGAFSFECPPGLSMEPVAFKDGDGNSANDSDPFPPKENGDPNNAASDVWFMLTTNDRVKLTMDLDRTEDGQTISALLIRTSAAEPCNQAILGETTFYRGAAVARAGLDQTLETKCIGPGTYIIVAEAFDLGTSGNFQMSVSCETWEAPAQPEKGEPSDDDGAGKSSFNPGEDVYVAGTGLLSNTVTPIIITEDRIWRDGDPIDQVEATSFRPATWVRTDADGAIVGSNVETPDGADPESFDSSPKAACIWSHPSPGEYDIVFDNNGNGIFEEGIDGLANNNVGTAGFVVLSVLEVPTLDRTGLVVSLLAFATIGFALLRR